jgi:hypothetical protein
VIIANIQEKRNINIGEKNMSAHNDIRTQLAAYEAENDKFEKGNSAAGTRARKALAELAKAVKARRNEITAEKAARKEAKAK